MLSLWWQTLSIGWFGWDHIFERFAKLKNAQGVIYESRLDFWKDSLNAIRDFTLTGSGFGTYVDIYPSYQTVNGDLTVDHAHNDYIETLVQGGLVGFTLAALFIITLFTKTYASFLKRKDAYCVYLYMGSITGLLAILFHGFTDFNIQIGANGLWFFFMAGIAVSAANTQMRSPSPSTRLLPVRSDLGKRTGVVLAVLIMAGGAVYNLSLLTGYYYFSHIKKMTMGSETPVDSLEKINKIAGISTKFDPLNADYVFALANSALYLDNAPAALENFKRAIVLSPANSIYLQRLGLYLQHTKGHSDTTEKLLRASVDHDISDPDYALEYGAWLLSANRVTQATGYIRRALELKPEMIDRALTIMAIWELNDTDMEKAVPEIPGPYIAWANFLYSRGKRELGEQKYLKALDYIEEQKEIKSRGFYRVYRFFQQRGKTETALKVMQRAARVLPLDAGIRITLGDIYQKMGVSYRAEQEYEQALFLDPDNKRAKQRLNR